MKPDPISLNRQLQRLSQLADDTTAYRSELQRLRRQLVALEETRDDELAALRKANQKGLEAELERVQTQAQSQIQTLKLESQQRETQICANLDQTLRQLESGLTKELAALEERRKSESWILQSVLDEESSDSPIAKFEREAETYVSQKTFLDEQLEELQQHVDDRRQLLERCHTAPDTTLPAPQVPNGSREELRDAAIEFGDALVAESTRLSRRKATHWVMGMRLWGLGLLGFVVLWLMITALRADLRQFVNPELTKPDWEWVGVAAIIALAVVALGSITLLMTVQGKLRSGFQNVLQQFSNAQQAVAVWDQKSEKNIDRLDRTAQQWRTRLESQRTQQAASLQAQIDAEITKVRTETEEQIRRTRVLREEKTRQMHVELAAAEIEFESRRKTDILNTGQQFATALESATQASEERYQQSSQELLATADRLLEKWNTGIQEIRAIRQIAADEASGTLRWPTESGWALPTSMPQHLSVGDLLVTAEKQPESVSDSESTKLCVEFPAVLRFPTDTSILVEHQSAGREPALSFIRTQILKLLTIIPAGRIRLTLIDPVGLGQSFAAMMHLADFDELLIHSRIWTDSSQIRDQLQKVTEHMENIFQTYLRSQFDTIEEYNESAGEVAEPYHFVVVAGFPTAFSEESARHLSSILTSGPRCGVHALVAWNPTVGTPPSFDVEDLTNNCVRFQVVGDTVQPKQALSSSVVFEAFPEPLAEKYVSLVRDVGEQSKDARRVEVSFKRISPRSDEIWTRSTAEGLDLPIGRAGAARLQFMRLGRGTSQHVLIAGKTGSGKSTFLHILITNLALHYGPDEIQFYLIDFKKGVEFRTYAANRLPHARVVAIESDREFGLSVLERLDEVLQERGELFRDRGVQDVPSFRERFPAEPMPRLLLLIDEFQEFFVAEDRVSSRASLLLDRLIRQGRAFGIHVLLGSQTLGGAYSLARSTMGQIAVRIALQCSDSDAHLILSEDNMAARHLARPGEAIYNDANGLVQGNHQFQIAWLEESEREEAIRTMLKQQSDDAHQYSMVVFEGNVPPTVELCGPLNAWLNTTDDATRKPTDGVTIWLGEPVAISAPTCVELRHASGQNMLIVGQDEKTVDNLLACTIVSLGFRPTAAGDADTSTRVTLLHDGRDAESRENFDALGNLLPPNSLEIKAHADCRELVERMYQEVVQREGDTARANRGEEFLLIRNIGQFRDLRKDEDDFSLGKFGEPKAQTSASMFSDILKRGPLVGVHVVVWSDTFSNAIRWLSNSLLREFETRIAFRMNQTDSASLVDNPIAASMGPGRAIVYRDQTGTTEKFRPFAWPSTDWIKRLRTGTDSAPESPLDIDSLNIE